MNFNPHDPYFYYGCLENISQVNYKTKDIKDSLLNFNR